MNKTLVFASLCFLILAASASHGQRIVYVCPEGTYMSSVFGYIECLPLDGGRSERPEPKPDRPNIGSTALGATIMGQKVLADLARVVKDPKYKGYSDGEWFFEEPKNGESCSATFMRRGVGVTVLGPSRELPGAFLILFGPDLPAPAALTKTRVTLSQTGEQPATVQALNSAFPTIEKYGAVVFQVPSLEAALSGIEQVHKFGVSIDGKTLAEIEWSDGFAARDRLTKCTAAAGK